MTAESHVNRFWSEPFSELFNIYSCRKRPFFFAVHYKKHYKNYIFCHIITWLLQNVLTPSWHIVAQTISKNSSKIRNLLIFSLSLQQELIGNLYGDARDDTNDCRLFQDATRFESIRAAILTVWFDSMSREDTSWLSQIVHSDTPYTRKHIMVRSSLGSAPSRWFLTSTASVSTTCLAFSKWICLRMSSRRSSPTSRAQNPWVAVKRHMSNPLVENCR